MRAPGCLKSGQRVSDSTDEGGKKQIKAWVAACSSGKEMFP
jgi:chemotaxis methyl-accepting protein methylase